MNYVTWALQALVEVELKAGSSLKTPPCWCIQGPVVRSVIEGFRITCGGSTACCQEINTWTRWHETQSLFSPAWSHDDGVSYLSQASLQYLVEMQFSGVNMLVVIIMLHFCMCRHVYEVLVKYTNFVKICRFFIRPNYAGHLLSGAVTINF